MSEISNSNCKVTSIIKKIMDLIYLCLLGLYLARSVFDKTMFELTWPERYYDYLHIAMILFLIIKIIVYDLKSVRALIFDILYLTVFYFVYKGTGYIFLLEFAFFVFAAKCISYQKILRFYFVVVSSVILTMIFGAMTGCIQDLIYVENNTFKHAFGFVYTTNFAAQIFFLTITYLAWKEKVPSYLFNVILLGLAVVLYRYTGARNSSGCMVLLVLGGLYVKYSDKEILNSRIEGKWRKIRLKVIQFIDSCLTVVLPVAAFVSLGLTLLYSWDNPIMNRIDRISSGRLQLGKAAIEKYGISLWGTPFKMIGLARNYVTRTDYNFVDSSYVMICVRYGVVLFLLMILGFVWLAIKAKRAQKRYLVVLLAVMALQSVIEHHLITVYYNSLVLIIFSDIINTNNSKDTFPAKRTYRSIFKYGFVMSAVLIIYFYFYRIAAFGRTIVTLLNLNYPKRNIYFIIASFIGLFVCVLTIYLLWKLYLVIFESKSKKMLFVYGIGSALGISIIIVGIYFSNNIISKKVVDYKQTLNAGKEFIEKLNQLEDINLYIDDVPYLYIRDKDITKKIIPGNPYRGDVKNAVIITKSTNEFYHLIESGYLCGQISAQEYLYTNDMRVVKIARENGMKMDNFYAKKQYINLKKLAKKNKVNLDSNGSLIIGGENSISKGLKTTIYNGIFKVEYDLELLNADIVNGEVAILKITSYSGANILKEVTINRSDFNESGYYLASFESCIPDSVDVEFLLYIIGDAELKLNSLTYERVGRNE